jgi:penicillin-binding protein 1A
VVSGKFVKGDAPTTYCTLHVPVFLCREDPLLDSEGNPFGMYHIAGEYCPAESKISVAVVDYNRDTEGLTYGTRDDHVILEQLQGIGTCHVHTQPPEPEIPELPPLQEPTTEPEGTEDEGWHWPWEGLFEPEPTPAEEAVPAAP